MLSLLFLSLLNARFERPLDTWFTSILAFMFILFLFCCISAELNRSPIDLLEAERELIRGYNIETRSTVFILVFVREYSIILVYSTLIASFCFE